MEKILGIHDHQDDDDEMDLALPPGFRFHPTDEEVISQYLYKKVMDSYFSAKAIGDVDLNKVEPWELPWKAKMGEKEWYFFSMRDRKYPTGLRTNRATEAGYWKATGKDKEIYKGKSLVGMKKTLVFYMGRAPKGDKTNWVMHEFRLEGKYSAHNLPKTTKNECVISKVFQKNDGKKGLISGGSGSFGNDFTTSCLPPLMDSSPLVANTKPEPHSGYVPCFSNQMNQQNSPLYLTNPNNPLIFQTNPLLIFSNSQYPIPMGSVSAQDEAILMQGMKIETDGRMMSVSQETDVTSTINNEISSIIDEAPPGLPDFDCLWNY